MAWWLNLLIWRRWLCYDNDDDDGDSKDDNDDHIEGTERDIAPISSVSFIIT